MPFQHALRLIMPWRTSGDDAQISSLIERLSYLVAEGERLSGLNQANQGLEAWIQKVRRMLTTGAPEFLPAWDGAEADTRLETLREINRELRRRL
jgi:hypothetical protein